MKTRLFVGVALCLVATALGQAQVDWKTSPTLPGVDLSVLSKAQKDVALSVLRSEQCGCGCEMKLAECRTNDPKCAVSNRLADLVVREASAGKTAVAIRESVKKMATQAPPLLEDKAAKLAIDGDPMKGPADAKVTIVEFSDFQCPYCAKAVGEVNTVMAKFPRDVRLDFKQYPLDTHSQAGLAAEAALAAQAQGKFWELHDKMYANFRSINRDKIFVWAKEIGLDMKRFQTELDSHKYAARVVSEVKQGDDAGVEGTPTFFINGKRLNAGFDLDTVGPLITERVKH
jgi:protein-disulfide isomerase